MVKILSIGNSFSQDAQDFLKGICDAAGAEVLLGNLFIGGCSLERHWQNISTNAENYSYETNGCKPGVPAKITDVVEGTKWDIITLQQASHFSGKWETYEPYLTNIANYVRKQQPNATIFVHETWAYEVDSKNGAFKNYESSQEKMYLALKACYRQAAQQLGASIIPVGDVVQHFRKEVPEFNYPNGGLSLCRDGFHLNLLYGRFLAGLVWFETLLGGNAAQNSFVPCLPQEQTNLQLVETIRREVHSFLKK